MQITPLPCRNHSTDVLVGLSLSLKCSGILWNNNASETFSPNNQVFALFHVLNGMTKIFHSLTCPLGAIQLLEGLVAQVPARTLLKNWHRT